jgi:hypothetical protein
MGWDMADSCGLRSGDPVPGPSHALRPPVAFGCGPPPEAGYSPPMHPLLTNDLINGLIEETIAAAPPTQATQPDAVIYMGGVAAGKSTLRRRDHGIGFVPIDAAALFLRICAGKRMDFPGELDEVIEFIGTLIAVRALNERRPVVTEIIGDDETDTVVLMQALKSIGYRVTAIAVTCDVGVAAQRNASRDADDISAYFAGPYHMRWIVRACHEVLRFRARPPKETKPPLANDIAARGCSACFPEEAAEAFAKLRKLRATAVLADESHFHASILACGRCHQRVVAVFTEVIDWQDGDDPQFWAFLPVTMAEALALAKLPAEGLEAALNSLPADRKSLVWSSPSGASAKVHWGRGMHVGPHD